MADSTRLIKKYYHSIKNLNMSGIINQIDYLTELASTILDADFMVILFKKEENQFLIPISIQNQSSLQNPNIESLEEKWCRRDIGKDQILSGLISMESHGKSGLGPDKFAQFHNLKFMAQYPCYKGNSVEILSIAYWFEEPVFDENRAELSFIQINNLLKNSMRSIQDNQLINDFTLRLSDLIALFEIQVQQYSFDELVDELFARLKKIVPGEYLLYSSDKSSKSFYLNSYNTLEAPASSCHDKIVNELTELTTDLQKLENNNGIWVEYSKQFSEYYNSSIATPIYFSSQESHFIFRVCQQSSTISDNDKQLLSLYSLFTGIILKVSSLFEKEKMVNDLLKKTTSQMADVETLAALTDMTSGVAHDFNNMIGGIIGRVQLLKLKVKDPEIVDKLEKIEILAANGAQTVKRIQEFASTSSEKQHKPVNISEIINTYQEETDKSWYKKSEDKSLSIIFNVSDQSMIIECHPEDILLAMDKLLENAVDHAQEHSEITVQVSNTNNYCQFSINNRGPLIPITDIKKIFYPFFTTKHEYGSGMGLAIVHGIVTRHGGKITVRSNEEEGTTFVIRIKLTEKRDEDSEITKKEKNHGELRILVVDDDEQIREVLSDMLTIDGYQVTACVDGPSALKEFEKSTFEIMITDLGMPGMSGLELAGLVHEQKPEVPIAMITGWGTQLNKDEVALKGVKAVLPKPFHLKDIKGLIKDMVKHIPV